MKKKNFEKRNRTPIDLEKVNASLTGKDLTVEGLVDRIAQTGGPTLFSIIDGTGTLILKGFESPGERAYPDIKEGDFVKSAIKVNEFNGMLEGEIKKIEKLSEGDNAKLKKKIEDAERARAKPINAEFMIKSPILDKLKDRFLKVATEIRLAIIQNRPIILRHHNDADGYSSGFALEKAILPLIEKQHGFGKAQWEYYTRAPCAAPFYEIDDSIRDTATSLRNVAKYSNKMPLVIIADNGSSQEDLFGIKQGKVHGIEFIVVDHHYFEKDVISDEVLVHINPFLVGEDGSKFSAGMLCSELARFISEVENIEQIPAMAGLADRIDNPDALKQYIALAEKEGYDKRLLADIATVVDFVSAKLRFMEAREYIEVLFGEPRDKQKALVNLMTPVIRKMETKGLEIAKSSVKKEKIGKCVLQTLDIETSYSRGFYPKPGRCNGMVHDYAVENGEERVVSAGVLNDAITIRASEGANFSVPEFIVMLNKDVPEAFAEGGGHKNAGAVKFVPSKRGKVLECLREFIKGR